MTITKNEGSNHEQFNHVKHGPLRQPMARAGLFSTSHLVHGDWTRSGLLPQERPDLCMYIVPARIFNRIDVRFLRWAASMWETNWVSPAQLNSVFHFQLVLVN
jgi:hypothetical protein